MSRTFSFRRTILFIGPVVALLLTLAGMLAFHLYGSTSTASAHSPTTSSQTLFVGHVLGTNDSCASPGYISVQAAVDAANTGDIVYLCGNTPYQEQVIITKSITLTGDPGATIKSPTPFPNNASRLPPQFSSDNLFIPQAIVVVWGKDTDAKIVNLIITGPLPGNNSCADEEYGMLVIAGGEANLKGDQITNIHDANTGLYGCQFGVGIQVGRRYWPTTTSFSSPVIENFTGRATITKTTVTGYQKNGITVDGPGSKADITDNTVEGAGRDTQFAVIIAQNGIQISRGAVGRVHDNFVADNSYTGTAPNASSGGILVFGGCGDPLSTGVDVEENVLSNNDVGIYLNNYSSATDCSAPATHKTNVEAENNTISNDAVTNRSGYTASNGITYPGYQAGIDDVGNNDLISENSIAGIGYTPARLTASGPLVIPIDTFSFPTIHPRIHENRII